MNNARYIQFLDSCRMARAKMISDSLDFRKNNPDLYDAFWSDYGGEIHRIRIKLYELQWILAQWKHLEKLLEQGSANNKEKNQIFNCWVNWYSSYLSKWQMNDKDINLLSVMIQGLDELVHVHEDWEKKRNILTTDLKRNKRILENMVKRLQEDNNG